MTGNNSRKPSQNNLKGQAQGQASASSLPRTRSSAAALVAEPNTGGPQSPTAGALNKKKGVGKKGNDATKEDSRNGPRQSLPLDPRRNDSSALAASPAVRKTTTSISTPAPVARKATTVNLSPAPTPTILRRRTSVEDVVDEEAGERGLNPLPKDHPRILIDSDEDPDLEDDVGRKCKGKGRAAQATNAPLPTDGAVIDGAWDDLPDIDLAKFEELRIGNEDPGSISQNLASTARANSPASEYPYMFARMGHFLQLRVEPMEASIANYHAVLDPATADPSCILRIPPCNNIWSLLRAASTSFSTKLRSRTEWWKEWTKINVQTPIPPYPAYARPLE